MILRSALAAALLAAVAAAAAVVASSSPAPEQGTQLAQLTLFLSTDCSDVGVTLPIYPGDCDSSPFNEFAWMRLRLDNVTNAYALEFFADGPDKPCTGAPLLAKYGQGAGCLTELTHFNRIQSVSLASAITTPCRCTQYSNAMCIGSPFTVYGIGASGDCQTPLDPNGQAQLWQLDDGQQQWTHTIFAGQMCAGDAWTNRTGTFGTCSDSGAVVTSNDGTQGEGAHSSRRGGEQQQLLLDGGEQRSTDGTDGAAHASDTR